MSFAKHDSDILKVVNATQLACVPKHSVLFKVGERGHCFYVSLSGTAQFFFPNQLRLSLKQKRKIAAARVAKLHADEPEIKRRNAIDPISTQLKAIELKKLIERATAELDAIEKELSQTDEMTALLQFTKGMHFGELSLL